MQTERSNNHSGNWFLITNRDGLAVKILNSITVGEHSSGTLVIDSVTPDERWATLTFDVNGNLLVSAQNRLCQLQGPGALATDNAGYYVPRGTILQMPNNEIYISGDFLRGIAKHKISLTLIDVPTHSSVQQSHDRVEPEKVKARPPKDEPQRSVDIINDQKPFCTPVIEPTNPQLAPITAMLGDEQDISSKQTWSWRGTFLTVVTLSVLAGVFAVRNHNDYPPTAPELINQSAKDSIIENTSTSQATQTSTAIQEASPAENTPIQTEEIVKTTNDTTKRLNFGPQQTITPISELSRAQAPPVNVQALLRDAKRLLSQGFIIWPDKKNAVLLILQAQQAEPNNMVAAIMLDEAADTLIEHATRAYNDGFNIGAAKVVKDVLRFHPSYQPALEWGRNKEVQ